MNATSQIVRTGKLTMEADFNFKHPTILFIIGARGTGKSATMHHIAEQYHNQNIPIQMLAPNKLRKNFPQKPEWLTLVNYKYGRIKPNTVTLFDDAQLRLHARTWYAKKQTSFDKMITMSRHRKSTLIITTQETFRLDRNIVAAVDALIIKKPGWMASKMERAEIRKFLQAVRKQFEDEIEAKGLDIRKYSYIMTDTYEGFVGPTDLPSYWSKELGDW